MADGGSADTRRIGPVQEPVRKGCRRGVLAHVGQREVAHLDIRLDLSGRGDEPVLGHPLGVGLIVPLPPAFVGEDADLALERTVAGSLVQEVQDDLSQLRPHLVHRHRVGALVQSGLLVPDDLGPMSSLQPGAEELHGPIVQILMGWPVGGGVRLDGAAAVLRMRGQLLDESARLVRHLSGDGHTGDEGEIPEGGAQLAGGVCDALQPLSHSAHGLWAES